MENLFIFSSVCRTPLSHSHKTGAVPVYESQGSSNLQRNCNKDEITTEAHKIADKKMHLQYKRVNE